MGYLVSRLVISAVLCAAFCYAQTSTGQIAITVFDPTGAVIPNAAVTLTGSETGEVVRTLETDGAGSAIAPLLRPGPYTVTVTVQGFKRPSTKSTIAWRT